jgi:hypothetical protein
METPRISGDDGHQAAIASFTSDDSRTRLEAASLAITAPALGIHACNRCNDVFSSIAIGVNHGGDDDHANFAPGLNQLWNVLTHARDELLGSLVVAADSMSKPSVLYVGAGTDYMHARMTLHFDSFSNPLNPIEYKVEYEESTGLPSIITKTFHYQNNETYITTSVHFADVSYSEANTDFANRWKDTMSPVAFKLGLFLQKAIQVWDICRCYHFTPTELLNCLALAAENGRAFDIVGQALSTLLNVGGHLDIINQVSLAFDIKPQAKFNGEWVECWRQTSGSEYDIISNVTALYEAAGGGGSPIGTRIAGWVAERRNSRIGGAQTDSMLASDANLN